MANRKANRTRKASLLSKGAQHVTYGEVGAAAFAVGEVAQRDASEAGQDASVPEMGPQPVESVGLLAIVLEKENCTSGVRKPGSPEEGGQDGEVSTEQRALGNAGHEGYRASDRRRETTLEELKEPVEHELRLVSSLGHHRPVNARTSVRLKGSMQDGDVRTAHQELGRLGGQVEQREKPPRPATAAGAKDGARVWVAERTPKCVCPDSVRSRQVAVRIEEVSVENGGVALCEARNTAAQELTVDGTRRTNDGNAVSRPQWRGA